jgi:HNH/Endo VII superfamily nuclease toxin with a HHH motif/Domain of unknown function (DUF4157)
MKAAEQTPTSVSQIQRKSASSFFVPSTEQEQPFFAGKEASGNNGFFKSAQLSKGLKPLESSRPTIQAKLTVGAPNDTYEQEADTMADKVVQRLSNSETVQRSTPPISMAKPEGAKLQMKCMDCEEEDRKHLQRKENGAIDASPSIESRLSATKGGGSPLQNNTRSDMESSFGADFSGVRVHTGGEAVQMSKDLNAHAFTHGSDVYFNSGKYNPSNTEGSRLLAHELTHTVQQGSGIKNSIQKEDIPGLPVNENPLVLPTSRIEMPWVGNGAGVNSSELGYLRNPTQFWREFQTQFGQELSEANRALIAAGRSPVVDAQWLEFNPQHNGYLESILEHHHVGQGSNAVALPEELHDAYTVFHPQRRVIGTAERGIRPRFLNPDGSLKLPDMPTRVQMEAEVARHTRAGRIVGRGVTPQTAPELPAIAPASELSLAQEVSLGTVPPTTSSISIIPPEISVGAIPPEVNVGAIPPSTSSISTVAPETEAGLAQIAQTSTNLSRLSTVLRGGARVGGGGLGLLGAVLSAQSLSRNIESGNFKDVPVDAAGFVSGGLATGAAITGSALLGEGALVTGAFGAGYSFGNHINETTGIQDTANSAGQTIQSLTGSETAGAITAALTAIETSPYYAGNAIGNAINDNSHIGAASQSAGEAIQSLTGSETLGATAAAATAVLTAPVFAAEALGRGAVNVGSAIGSGVSSAWDWLTD